MKIKLLGLVSVAALLACSPKTAELVKQTEMPVESTPILASLDLVHIEDDRVQVSINPGLMVSDTVVFRLPKVVQGTYDISDFGSFVDDFVAYDYRGNLMNVIHSDENTWKIVNTSGLDRIEYRVNDTFDIEGTEKPTPFSPSGTNIEPEAFVLNLHGFVGYFEAMEDLDYEITIKSKEGLQKSSALPLIHSLAEADSGFVYDTYAADRYFEVTDNPMMYGNLDIEEFQVGDIKIVLSVYDAAGNHTAAHLKETLYTMMEAQKAYLGNLNSTPRYDVFLYVTGNGSNQATGFGALEHHRSTVVVLPGWMNTEMMDESMIDVVSHEFFHIVTPLSVHSEDVHYFDYYAPTFSKHLWMYEGATEYFATHFQVYEGLQQRDAFYEKIEGKINTSYGMDDEMSFTVMSENVVDEPYASNYYNVYMKGALINMCLDILLRKESNGKMGMLDLMKKLSEKYGIEKPFVDDDIIAEITEMTYPSIGEFLQTHVVGTTPIDYSAMFEMVGLSFGDFEEPTSFFFEEPNLNNAQVPFIDGNPKTGELFFREIELNTSLAEMGVEPGDVIKSINGQEYTLQNLGASGLIPASFSWTPVTEISMVVVRDGEEIELSGVVGNPTVIKSRLHEDDDATPEQVKLRNWWLDNPRLQLKNDKASIQKAIETLFDGMRAGDSAMVASVFADNPPMNSVFTNREGKVVVNGGSLDRFLESVGGEHDQIFDERIFGYDINVDGDLASVWTPYEFYLGETFSHCGVNSFQMARLDGEWKIIYIVDTRRRTECVAH